MALVGGHIRKKTLLIKIRNCYYLNNILKIIMTTVSLSKNEKVQMSI